MSGTPWVVVVPQKDLAHAKSRLRLSPSARRAVAQAMFADTVRAAHDAAHVGAVVVVVDTAPDAAPVRSPPVDVLERPGLTLNAAISAAGEHARARWPGARLAALPADLPGLRSAELDVALQTAAGHRRTFVADRHGDGTTLLTALSGEDLDPRFGPASRLAHLESGAWENPAAGLSSLRHDVDDLGDLAELASLDSSHRLGPHLQAVLEKLFWQTHEEIA